jgi:hypothetical protein
VKSKVEAVTGWSRIGRHLQRHLLQCAAFAITGCVIATPKSGVGQSRAEPAREQRAELAAPPVVIVIVTVDGVRWHEVFEGVDRALAEAHGLPPSGVVSAAELTPNLHRIVSTQGAALGAPGHGEPINASGPNFVSLPGYAELLSGRRVTDCKDNLCRGSGRRTLFDDFAIQAAPDGWHAALDGSHAALDGSHAALDGSHAVSFTSWPDISKVASERGPLPEPAPRPDTFRPDALTADLAIQYLRARAPKFMFLGLGEPDEFGHANDYAGYLRSLRYADQRIGEIHQILQELAARGTRTALFVTADHGRADSFVNHGAQFPESARVWLIASGSALHATGYVASPKPRSLADLAPTVRQIAGLPRDTHAAAGAPLDELLHLTLF